MDNTPQAFREPQGQTRGAIESNTADDTLLMIRNGLAHI